MLRLTNKRREEASVKRALTLENEIELIEGCRVGKDSARKELYTLYSKQMLAVCYRYTGDVDAAHDVLHDGFIKIFTHFTFRGECALGTWVTRVMVTQAIDYLRKQQRFSQLVVNEEQLPDIPDEASIVETGGRISEEMLMAFVAELPDGCRTVFNLYVSPSSALSLARNRPTNRWYSPICSPIPYRSSRSDLGIMVSRWSLNL